MAGGLSIYYVPPRLVGPINRWSGLSRPSPILTQVKRLGMNAIWLSPFHPVTKVEKHKHGEVQTGSLYAMRDHFTFDPEFSSGSTRADSRHLKAFTAKARQDGLTVMADLVFNHVAADHPLVIKETRQIEQLRKIADAQGVSLVPLYGKEGDVQDSADHGPLVGWRADGALKLPAALSKRMENGRFLTRFQRNMDGSAFIDGPEDDPWSDAVKINYDSPEGFAHFVTGHGDDPGYWEKSIDWYLDHGFNGFRCDVAYAVPPRVWSHLVQHAHDKQPDVTFMGETIGGGEMVNRLEQATITDRKTGKTRKAFDHAMHGQYWWDYRDNWYADHEVDKNRRAARFGGAAFPDNHDTPDTLAGALRKQHGKSAKADQIIADTLVRDWTIAALTGNSAYMQMGYEFARETQNEVFKGHGSVADWKQLRKRRDKPGSQLNLVARLAAVNGLKHRLGIDNSLADIIPGQTHYNGRLSELQIRFRDADTGAPTGEIKLMVNLKPEDGPVEVNTLHHAGLQQDGTRQILKSAHEANNPRMIRDVMILHTPPKPGSTLTRKLRFSTSLSSPKTGNP
ncbi:MAG: hypothetical protein Alpg2KO_25520 [Alphaproteobacteria bacterium]